MRFLPLAVLLALTPAAQAQRGVPVTLGGPAAPAAKVVEWAARVTPVPGRRGAYRLALTGAVAEGWRVYAMGSPGGRPLTVALDGVPAGFRLSARPTHVGAPRTGRDEALGTSYTYFADEVEIAARVDATARARRGRHVVRGAVTYAACNDSICLPPRTEMFEAALAHRAGR